MMTWSKSSLFTISAGAVLVVVGVFLPSATLVALLRSNPADFQDQLLLGGALFKIGLVILGLAVIALERFAVPEISQRSASIRRETNRTVAIAILAAILVVATALRIYRLDAGLWLDEILTYSNYAQLPFGELVSTYGSENQHFLYSLLAHASFMIFGPSAWSLRLPAVLFGVASIWALYMFAREVTSTREALLSAALLAFSYHHVWFSQNARGYTGLLFWTLASSWLLFRALRDARPKLWLLYAAAASLGVYTHMTMLFVIFGQFITYLIAVLARRKEHWPYRWAGLLLGFVSAGFLTFFLYALVLPQVLGVVGGSEASVVQEWKNPLWTAFEIIRGLQVGFSGGIAAIIALLLFAVGIWSYFRTAPIVIALLIIPPVVGAVVTLGVGHHLWPRFFFFAFGFGALIVVRGVMVAADMMGSLLKWSPQRSILLGTALCIAMIALSSASMIFAFGPKQDYEGALAYVESNRSVGDAVVTINLAANVYKNFYSVDWEVAETRDELDAIREQADRTWILYTFRPVAKSVLPEIMTSVESDFQLLAEFPGSVNQGTVFVALSDRPPAK